MDQHISRQLNFVVRRLIRLRCWWALSWLWSLVALVTAIVVMTLPVGNQAVTVFNALFCAALLGSAWLVRPRRVSEQQKLATARLIEQRWPDLNQRLLTVIEQTPNAAAGGFSWLQQELASEVRSHSYSHDWKDGVPTRRILTRVATTLCAIVLSVCLADQLRTEAGSALAALDEPTPEEQLNNSALEAFNVSVEPGTAEVERGRALLITATFDGRLPSTVTMLEDPGKATAEKLETDESNASARPMRQSLKDPLFGTRLPSVDSSFEYQIQFDDQRTEVFRISVYDLPRVAQVDALIEFPSYSDMPNELIEDTWRVSTVEGSSVVLKCRLNKQIADGRLIDEDGREFELLAATSISTTSITPRNGDVEPTANEPPGVLYQTRIPVDKTRRLTFRLTDDKGRRNREEDEFVLTAVPNRPPEIKLVFPGRDLRVSPIEELQLEATVWDDFGISEHGVVLALADREPRTISLGEKAAARQKHELAHLLALEPEHAEPDQLVSYYFFADDFGVAGEKRRTMSDMFFAEVRHFEEIFREGQPPPGGAPPAESKNAKKAEELGELQKQIIAATWKIIRRETRDEVSPAFADDVTLLVESQQEAISQMNELIEELEDAQSKMYAADVVEAMKTAVVRLVETHEKMKSDLLTPALTAERAAYQGLLKLRAREHQVTQQQSSPSKSSGSKSASQQQLDQLELDNKKNRYEAEQQANQQELEQQNREELQVLNRLRELARRQGDLNQKLKELEHELKAAKTEAEQEEIERQLKRLREEQKELLRDVDELKDRMEKPENQQEMADTREKLEDTRSKVRQASEALEEGKLSQALNEGTRAERELEKLRDEVRQKAAGQFGEAMKDLRQQAREIGQRQDQIAEALNQNAPQQGERPSLRTKQKPSGEKLQEQLDEQHEQLDQVMEKMREVVEKADTAEPLLARQLYETVRKTRSDRASEALDETRDLNRRGLTKDAAVAERRAHDSLDRMQKGIEQAAEAVLGNELETLKRASRELAEAGKAVQQELAQADPEELQKMRNGREAADPGAEENPAGNSRQDGSGQSSKPGDQKADEQTEGSQSQQQDGTKTEQKPGDVTPKSQQQKGDATGEGNQKPGDKPGAAKSDNENQQGSGEGQKPGQQPSNSDQKGQGGKPGEQPGQESTGAGKPQSGNPSRNPDGQQKSDTPGEPKGQGQSQQGDGQSPGGKPGEGQSEPGQSSGGQGEGQSPSESQGQQAGQQPGPRQRPGLRPPTNQPSQPGSQRSETAQGQGGSTGPGNPITGQGFVQWSDQIRNVEELIDDPKLRAEVARIREAARSMRAEFKRHSKEPQWGLVRMEILEPLAEIQEKIREEIARRESPDSLVPIDRDPVPDKYAELVRRYYERIGSGK
ncbi:MAG: hypothetical protein HQ518_26810 [Rhodopirellula sp.]|nr:hypothetical protein [Rhodopirellula sp.]